MITPSAHLLLSAAVQGDNLGALLLITFGVPLVLVLVSRSRSRWGVGACSCVLGTLAWAVAFGALLSATPCGLSGSGVLTSSGQCPVMATHYVSAVVGGLTFLSLFVGSVGGVAYAALPGPRARRVFQSGILIAAALLAVWMIADMALPRDYPTD